MKQKWEWLDRKEYPFAPKHFAVGQNQLHYIDEGEGEILLFVHGTPSWSFDFRYQIKALSQHCRCIALDHIGFGLSDKPAEYDYRTQNHALTLQKFIEHLNVKDITLIMHDFGGVIGFDYALKNVTNIKRLVVLNSWLWDASQEPEYQKLRKILRSPLLPFLYQWLNFSPRFILPQSFANPKKLTKRLHKHYTAPFANRKERKGALAFAHSLLHDQAWFQSLGNQLFLLKDKPMLLIWGMKDPVVLPHHLAKFEQAFLYKKVVKVETAGHFPQEEEPEIVLAALSEFLRT
ncbi:MAG: alpha/beta fold hydrolase [Bacteroidia bacterium]